MNRRDLNRILMIGTALAAGWPVWLRRAFGAEGGPACRLSPGQEGDLRWRRIVSTAYRRGQQAGKPVLALVVPAVSDDDRGPGYERLWLRGRAFGELLNLGDDEALATLALAEVVCAPMSALRALVPGLAGHEPLMVLIETDEVPARVRLLDAELPTRRAHQPAAILPPEDWSNYLENDRHAGDRVAQKRIAVLSSLLHDGLRATPQMLLNRAAQAQARLDAQPPATIALPDDAGPGQLHRLSAILLAAAVGQPERERHLAIKQIADAARFVLCRRRVPGSRWADEGGRGKRVLDFLSRDATWRPS